MINIFLLQSQGSRISYSVASVLTELFKVYFHRHIDFAHQANNAHHALSRAGRAIYYCLVHKPIGFDLQIGLQPSTL